MMLKVVKSDYTGLYSYESLIVGACGIFGYPNITDQKIVCSSGLKAITK